MPLLWNFTFKKRLQLFLWYAVPEAEAERYFHQIIQNQKEMSREGMEMELFLSECPGIPKKGISKPKNCTNVFM